MAQEEKKGFWGTLGDILKTPSTNRQQRRPAAPQRIGGGRPQPKRPCGGCGK